MNKFQIDDRIEGTYGSTGEFGYVVGIDDTVNNSVQVRWDDSPLCVWVYPDTLRLVSRLDTKMSGVAPIGWDCITPGTGPIS